jgi:glucokinase-like ROK family protein
VKATQQHTKEHNRNLVLRTILEQDGISRAQISRVTGLTRTTVSEIVAGLMAEGLVRETGVGSSRGGKSPILLSLVADSRQVVGLDLGPSGFQGAIVDLRGRIRQSVEVPVHDRDGEIALASVHRLLESLLGGGPRPLVGIGIGAPGLVDAAHGVVVNAVNLGWRNLPLAKLLEERHQLPVKLLNDSQAAAVGEHTFGRGYRSDSSLVVINVRHGLGAGIVLNGALFHGDGGSAGEIGHVVVVREGGAACRCGNVGCLETVASIPAVVSRAQALAGHAESTALAGVPGTVTFDLLVQAFAAGDPVARQVVLEAGRFIGMAVSGLVGTLNVRNIVLSGGVTRFGEPLLDIIRATLAQSTLTRLARDTRVEYAQLGRHEIVLGAAALVLKDYSLLFKLRGPRAMAS